MIFCETQTITEWNRLFDELELKHQRYMLYTAYDTSNNGRMFAIFSNNNPNEAVRIDISHTNIQLRYTDYRGLCQEDFKSIKEAIKRLEECLIPDNVVEL